MSPERWQQVREIFAVAADLSAEERASVVHERCAGDEELRGEVERLLEQHDRPSSFLPGEPAAVTVPGSCGPEPLLAPGDVVLDRFRVLRLAGRGGMGEVYECEDIELQQPIALKALRTKGVGGDLPERFKREIQLARRVTHPNVCRVFDLGRHGDGDASILFFTMELVEGRTLADYLSDHGRLSPDEARPLIEQMASGLAALHDRNIIHRDLKPSNILLAPDGSGGFRVVLSDFGIAGTVTSPDAPDSFLTATGQILGTPDYMAPEQLTGKAAGPATDLFAFGIVVYEMLTGKRPFPDDSRRTLAPTPLRVFNPEIPRRWEKLILDCLQTGIDDRPRSVDAVFEALGLEAAPGRRPTAAALAVSPRSRRLRAGALGALFLAAVALGALRLRDNQQEPVTSEARRIAVLPLQVGEDVPELQTMADGLMDTITSRLSQYEGLNEQLIVVPASEVRKLAVTRADDARGVLGVNYAVEGRLAAQDDRVRLTLTLIDTERMLQRESAVINGGRTKGLDLEDNAVRRLATLLDLQAHPDQLDSIASVTPGAEDFYLQGKGYLQRSDDLESIDNAIQLFEKTIALDGSHARAYADLGQAYLYRYDRSQEPQWVAKAEEASKRALELNDQSLEAQSSRGRVLLEQGRYKDALSHFEAALALNPRSADAYAGLAEVYERQADHTTSQNGKEAQRAAAEAAYVKALSLRPNDWVSYKRLGLFYYRTGRYEDAIRQFENIQELAPDNAQAYVNLGVFHYLVQDRNEAIRLWTKALQLDPGRTSALTNLAKALHGEGLYEDAADAYERILKKVPASHRAWASLGDCYDKLGRKSDADEAYHHAIDLVERRIELEGESTGLNALLAHHWAHLRQFEKSRTYALKSLDSKNPEDQVTIAIAFSRAGDAHSARLAVDRALTAGYPETSIKEIDSLRRVLADRNDTGDQ